MRFLLWQTAYLGDVVLATPLIETLKLNFPNAEIGFVGRPFIGELLKGSGVKLLPYDKSWGESYRLLKRIRDYPVAISPHVSLRSALMLFLARIDVRIGFNRSEAPFLYTHTVGHSWEEHEVDRNLKLLEPLGVKEKVRKPKLYVEDGEIKEVLDRFSLKDKDYLVVSPSSNFPLKMWHPEGWREFVSRISKYVRVVITGTRRDVELARFVSEEGKIALPLAGKTSLRELMALIAASRLVVANDSAPVHIANALGVDAVSVYTSTSSRYGFYPLKGGFLESDVECSPCSPNPKVCRRGNPVCLSSVGVGQLIDLVHKLLGVQ